MNAPRGLILMYHRVTESPADPWGLNVSPHRFGEHLAVLRKHADPVRLGNLPGVLANTDSKHRPVVITFDDGYADNLHPAADLLAEAGVPATVFLVARDFDADGEFWWDELERILLRPGSLPQRFELSIGSEDFSCDLGDSAVYTEADCALGRRWRAWEQAQIPRQFLYYSLWRTLQPMPDEARRSAMGRIRAWASRGRTADLAHPLLTSGGVAELATREGIDIGAHTVTHPKLSATAPEWQRAEIAGSKSRLEQFINRRVDTFAYPYGDYTPETAVIVEASGFSCACSTRTGVVRGGDNRFEWARYMAEDVDGDEFHRMLTSWFAV